RNGPQKRQSTGTHGLPVYSHIRAASQEDSMAERGCGEAQPQHVEMEAGYKFAGIQSDGYAAAGLRHSRAPRSAVTDRSRCVVRVPSMPLPHLAVGFR